MKRLMKIRKPQTPPGKRGQMVLEPDAAGDAEEHHREAGRADQDEHHHGGEAHGRFVALLDQVAQVGDADGFEAEPDDGEIDHREGQLHQFAFADQHSDDHGDAYGGDADEKHLVPRAAQILVVDRGEDDGADGAHRAGFGRRRKAEHHGAQHHEDQHGRGNDAHQAFAPERPARQRPRFLRNRRDVVGLEDARGRTCSRRTGRSAAPTAPRRRDTCRRPTCRAGRPSRSAPARAAPAG